jgi:peptidoglycan/xylan/chitin deacetylase (PgdA/CDA1 family)
MFGLRHRKHKPSKVYGVISCDFEQDGGSSGTPNKNQTKDLKDFLKQFTKQLDELKAKATFYVQGDLAETFSKELKALNKKGHEMGLHGLHHELWGKVWFHNETPLTLDEMDMALDESALAFKAAGLPKSTNFRAPNMALNPKAYKVLADHGYTLDSSSPSYWGTKPRQYQREQLDVIPVTADPRPAFRMVHKVVPMTDFQVCNLYNVVNMSNKQFTQYIQRVVNYQAKHHLAQHFVFLTHPWEFKKLSNFDYCSPQNYKKLFSRFNALSKAFNIEWVTLETLNKRLNA